MSREVHVHESAREAVLDDEIIDGADVMRKVSTLKGVLGAAAGVESGGGNYTAWGVASGMLAEHTGSASRGRPVAFTVTGSR